MVEDSNCSVVSGVNFEVGLELEIEPENDSVFSDEFVNAAADLK